MIHNSQLLRFKEVFLAFPAGSVVLESETNSLSFSLQVIGWGKCIRGAFSHLQTLAWWGWVGDGEMMLSCLPISVSDNRIHGTILSMSAQSETKRNLLDSC